MRALLLGMGSLFRHIGAFFGSLWRFSMFWRVSPIGEARVGSPLAGGLLFLCLVFGVVGGVLVLLGFDLDQVDRWLDRQVNWMDLVGQLAFRALLGFILLLCIACVIAFFFDHKDTKPGWGMLIGALLIGWFVSATLFSPLDPPPSINEQAVFPADPNLAGGKPPVN